MSVTVIFGSMYSGKTTELIRRISRYQSIDKRVLAVNNQLDTRYSAGDSIITHDEYKFNCVKATTLKEVDEMMRITTDIDVVAIDEGQFFPDLKEYVLKFCETYEKDVIVAGLISDFKREKFGNMIDLFHYADSMVHLKALCTNCKDGTMAIFTKRVCTGTKQIDVGSTDKYVAFCRNCYSKG